MGRVTHYDTVQMMAYLLSRGSTLPYRKDGLIMHLDAIQNTRGGHNASATTWGDLSGNSMDVALYNATWGADYCAFTGADNSYGLGPKWTFASGGVTIEVVFSAGLEKINFGIAGWSYTGTHPSRPSIYSDGSFYRCLSGGGASSHPIARVSELATYIAFNSTTSRKNATVYTPTTILPATGTTINNFRLAQYGSSTNANSAGWGMPGRIMAVRVYDANLTAAELEAHWLIDKARFNIPD